MARRGLFTKTNKSESSKTLIESNVRNVQQVIALIANMGWVEGD